MKRRNLVILALALALPATLVFPMQAMRSWQPRTTSLPPLSYASMRIGGDGALFWRENGLSLALPDFDTPKAPASLANWNGKRVPFHAWRAGTIVFDRSGQNAAIFSLIIPKRSTQSLGFRPFASVFEGNRFLRRIPLTGNGSKTYGLQSALLALSPDGTRVAWNTALPAGAILAEARTGRPTARVVTRPLARVRVAHAAQFPVGALAFSPDGKQLAAVDPDSVYIADAATGKTRVTWKLGANMPPPTRLAFSPDGQSLALGYGSPVFWTNPNSSRPAPPTQQFLWVYRVNSGQRMASWSQPFNGGVHGGGITNLAWSPDSRHLAWGNFANQALIMNPQSGAIEGTFTLPAPQAAKSVAGLSSYTTAFVAFAPDGNTLAVASPGQVTLWRTR